jgi:cobalamin biosynthesis protein CobD/CbiB
LWFVVAAKKAQMIDVTIRLMYPSPPHPVVMAGKAAAVLMSWMQAAARHEHQQQ